MRFRLFERKRGATCRRSAPPGALPLLLAIFAAPAARAQADGGVGETIEVPGERPAGSPQAPGAAGTTVEVARFSGEVRSAAELLATSPGATVHSRRAGQSASLSLRGASADESLILLDGIPLQGPGGGSIDLATVPAALLDRMIVSRGVLGAQLGAGALGGAVELIPRRPTPRPTAAGQASFGSFGTAQLEGDLAAGGMLVGIQLDRTAGDFPMPRTTAREPDVVRLHAENSDSGEPRVSSASKSAGGDLELDLLLQATAGDRGLPGAATFTTTARARWTGRARGRAAARLDRRHRVGRPRLGTRRPNRAARPAAERRLHGTETPDCPRSNERRARRARKSSSPDSSATASGCARSSPGRGVDRRRADGLAPPSARVSGVERRRRPAARHRACTRRSASIASAAIRLSPGVTATVRPSGPLDSASAGGSRSARVLRRALPGPGGVTPNENLSPERAWSLDTGAAGDRRSSLSRPTSSGRAYRD